MTDNPTAQPDEAFEQSIEVQTDYERGRMDGMAHMRSLADDVMAGRIADELEIEALKARIEDLKRRLAAQPDVQSLPRGMREEVARALCHQYMLDDGYSEEQAVRAAKRENGMFKNFLAAADRVLSLPLPDRVQATSEGEAVTISPSDPKVIIAGIRQFGLAPDGSDLRDLERALSPVPTSEQAGVRRWRHKKRGTTYIEIGRGLLQTQDAGGLTDNEPMVIYRNEETGTFWVRDATEFEDGRFETIASSDRNAETPAAGDVK